MSNDNNLDLTWEWPADRVANEKIVFHVDSIESVSKGFLGIGGSPSLGNYLPDGKVLKGKVVAGNKILFGKSISIRAPGLEVKDIHEGDRLGIGLFSREVFICLEAVPVTISNEALNNWLENFKCIKS